MDADHFLRNHMHQFMRSNPTPQLISMPHQQNSDLMLNYESLPHELRALFHTLFNSEKVRLNMKDILPFKERKSKVAYCHRILTPKTESYRCFDCQIHPESLLCEDCFKRGNHDGHRYVQLRDQGDCDCGSKDLIKEEAFCPLHCGAEEIIEIDSSEEFIFNLYVRQLFIWIFKLIKIQQKDGELLFLYFLNYLTEINYQSPYYNNLTNRTIFAETDPIADYIFYFTLKAAECGKLVRAALSLFFKMLVLQQFKQRLLISLIINYNKIDNFQSSKYIKLFYPLLNETETVISAMNKNPVPLRPQRPFKVIEFYRLLSITKTISPLAAQAFLRPLLLVDVIVFPYLEKVEEGCENMGNLIVTVFPEFQKEEHFYYRLMCDIIRVTDDKQVLAAMISNYCKNILMYSFNKNKIILVPQRILALLIYKYFNYDLKKVDAEQICGILGLQQQDFLQQICRNWIKFAECLFQFASNLNRTNYFDNYINIYAKQNGQIICIDYLGFKIMAALSKNHRQTFDTVLKHIFRVDNEKLNKQDEEKSDLFKAGNFFLKIIIEIIYSPRAEFIVNSLLGHKSVNLAVFLKGLCRSSGQITQNQLDNIAQLLTFKEQTMQGSAEAVSYDPIKRKYTPISRQDQNDIYLQFFVSLLQTKFSKFIQRKTPSEKYLVLDDSQQQLKEILLNSNLLYSVCMKQMELIEDHPDSKILLKQMIRVLKTIKLAYGKQEKEYQDLLNRVYRQIRRKYIETQSPECLNRLFLQEIQGEISNNARVKQGQQVKDKQSQKRKQLLRLKKEKLMKERKIKQNQLKYIQPQTIQQQNQTEEMCLICRENKDSDQICYVGKLRFTNLLHNFVDSQGENAIFKSCFHTVHLDCFMRMQKHHQSALCPLCKCAINIVLPLQSSGRYALMEKISARIQQVLNYLIVTGQCKQKRGIILQIISYFTYLFAVNINDLGQITARQLRLCTLLYSLLENSLSFDHRQQQAHAFFDLSITKMKTKHTLLIYRNLLRVVHSVTFWNANNCTQVQQPLECIYDLSFHYTLDKILKVLTIINKVISSPETSALEPILIAFQGITPKIQDQNQEVAFLNFWKPPEDVNKMLKMRDGCSSLCKTGHQICFCLLCHMPNCLTCKQKVEHTTKEHPRECLMFNTFSGGLIYNYHGLEVMIKCLYVNETGKTWKPELKTDGFLFDRKVYNEILQELKGGSLFNYLITTFEGLKGNNITDRI